MDMETDTAQQATNIKTAISDAERLFSEIRDIRDELNILRSIANHQKIVQNKLFRQANSSAELDLTADYVVDDIAEMDRTAERIESTINGFVAQRIGNQQSDFANRQADEAAKQGRIFMVFTVSTVLFVSVLAIKTGSLSLSVLICSDLATIVLLYLALCPRR